LKERVWGGGSIDTRDPMGQHEKDPKIKELGILDRSKTSMEQTKKRLMPGLVTSRVTCRQALFTFFAFEGKG